MTVPTPSVFSTSPPVVAGFPAATSPDNPVVYNILGPVNYELAVAASVNFTAKGDLAVTGFATFTCTIDLSLNVSDVSQIDEDTDPTDLFEGTICGWTLKELNEIINDVDKYCAALDALAATEE